MVLRSRLAIFLALSTGLVYGQIDRASLNGTVTDASGLLVPQARVELVSHDTGLRREAETGPSGVFSITGLPIGSYDLKVSRDGFRASEVKGIQLFVGQTRNVDVRLEVGATSSQIEV